MRRLGYLGIVLAAFLTGCSTGAPSPAAPPAPPAEVPSALQFPTSVSIDVGTIRQTASPDLSALVGPAGAYSDVISFGADLAFVGEALADALLQPLPTLGIDVGTSIKTFENTAVPYNNEPPLGDGTAKNIEVKIDFADFDLDGDGVMEGCSGCTCPIGCAPDLVVCPSEAPLSSFKPICFRVWFDGVQRMTGLFDHIPTPDNPGQGTIRMAIDGDEASGQVGVAYDHRDPANRTTEIIEALAGPGLDPFTDPSSLIARFKVSQEGEDAVAKKTLNLNAVGGVSNPLLQSAHYIGRWREGQDFWSGTTEVVPAVPNGNLKNQCAFISTGETANRSRCQINGIDVEGITLVDPVDPTDVLLPDAFTPSPTF